jgi:hypothetical protein
MAKVAIAPRHVLGAEDGAFQRIDRDVDLGAGFVADLLADEQHRRLVELALADHHRAIDRQLVELAPHCVDRGLIGALSLPWPRSRAADTAARSVTRTISIDRMRSSTRCD